jgi:hypothetical protein
MAMPPLARVSSRYKVLVLPGELEEGEAATL